ncbi:TPA: hypothetical protein VCR75_000218 [Streptococcus pyogenes]|nr:hypothetical protein [Streptococcus pyogenes]
MIRAEIELGGKLEVVHVDVKTKEEAIEFLLSKQFGFLTQIWKLEEVNDETNSIESDNSGKPDGEGGDSQGDVLQAN